MSYGPWPFQPVILATDALLFLLAAVVTAALLWFRRKAPFREAVPRVFATPAAMAAAVLLSVYGAVAFLDSLHFRPAQYAPSGALLGYAPRVESVLDVLCWPLRAHEEQTYSAPFALTGLLRVTVAGEHGPVRRLRPRLRWIPPGVTGSASERADVVARVLRGTGEAVLLWSSLLLLAALYVRASPLRLARRLWYRETALPWRTFWVTVAVVLAVASIIANLAPAYHVLGTDQVGTDVLYKSLKSIRTGVVIGTLTTLITMPFAIVLGIVAGYFGGLVDDVIQYLYTTLSSIPGVLLIAASILSLDLFLEKHAGRFQSVLERADIRLLFLCIVLGITSWTSLCRLLRGETLKLRELEYVQAAIALGERRRSILLRHILPNVMHIVLISVVLDFSGFVLAEAVLTFVGVGVDPTTFSWGTMIDGARLELAREPVVWWNLGAAFGFMLILVLAANIFADAVRDALDPRFRRP